MSFTFLTALSQTLKDGARLVLDVPAIAECLLPNLRPHRTMEIAGIKVEIETRYDAGERRMHNDFTFTRNGQTEKRPSSQRIYTYHELAELLGEAGLEPVSAYSSLTEATFKPGGQRLLHVSTKR